MTAPQLALPVSQTQVGEVRVYRMVLPYLPPSKNVIDGWPPAWRSAAKRKWERDVKTECQAQMVPLGLWKVGLAAVLVFGSKGRRDPQNYAQAIWNWVPDALVKAGVLLDDREGCIEIPGNWGLTFRYDTRKGVVKGRRQRTILSLACHVE